MGKKSREIFERPLGSLKEYSFARHYVIHSNIIEYYSIKNVEYYLFLPQFIQIVFLTPLYIFLQILYKIDIVLTQNNHFL